MASTLLEFIRQLAIGAAADSARKTETGQELQGVVDEVFGVDGQNQGINQDMAGFARSQRVRADSEEGQRRLAEMSRQLEARKEAAMYGDPAMPTPEPPTQRKFGAPGTTFREGTPDSQRGVNALIQSIQEKKDYGMPAPDWMPSREKINLLDKASTMSDAERMQMTGQMPERQIDPDARGEDMNSPIDMTTRLEFAKPFPEKAKAAAPVAVAEQDLPNAAKIVKAQVSRMPAEVIEKSTSVPQDFYDSLDKQKIDYSGMSANDIAASYQAYLMTKQLPEKVRESQDEGFLSSMGKSLSNFFGNERNMLIMASAFNTLRFEPDQQLEKGIQERLKTLSESKIGEETVKYLLSKGRKDLIGLVRSGAIKAKDAITMADKADKSMQILSGAQLNQLLGTTNFIPTQMYNYSADKGAKPLYESPPEIANEKFAFEKNWEEHEKILEAGGAAVRTMDNVQQVIDNVDIANTGFGAPFFQLYDRIRAKLGSTDAEVKATATQELEAALGSDVFGYIRSLGIGARGLDTPAERRFLARVMSGTIDMTPDALKALARMRAKYAIRSMMKANETMDSNSFKSGYGKGKNFQKYEISDKMKKFAKLDAISDDQLESLLTKRAAPTMAAPVSAVTSAPKPKAPPSAQPTGTVNSVGRFNPTTGKIEMY